jgi:hypothetical protein
VSRDLDDLSPDLPAPRAPHIESLTILDDAADLLATNLNRESPGGRGAAMDGSAAFTCAPAWSNTQNEFKVSYRLKKRPEIPS